MDQNLAPVFGIPRSRYQPPLHQPVDQLNCTVMLHLQPFGQDSDRRRRTFQTFEGQKQLMLLGFEPGTARCLLAEMEETADLVAKLG